MKIATQRQSYPHETLKVKILSYNEHHHAYNTSIGLVDPFVSCAVKIEDKEKFIGKTIIMTGFFTGTFLPNEGAFTIEGEVK